MRRTEKFVNSQNDFMGKIRVPCMDLQDLPHKLSDALEGHGVRQGLCLEQIIFGDLELAVIGSVRSPSFRAHARDALSDLIIQGIGLAITQIRSTFLVEKGDSVIGGRFGWLVALLDGHGGTFKSECMGVARLDKTYQR